MILQNEFRPVSDYRKITEEILATVILKYNLKAQDITVIATTLGILGTSPIRKRIKVKELGEALIQQAMDIGKETFKDLNRRMSLVDNPLKKQKGVIH